MRHAPELRWIAPWLRGGACQARGDLVRAEVEYATAIEHLEAARLDSWRAATIAGYARTVHELGETGRARQLAHHALDLARQVGEDLPIGYALDVLAGLALASGDLDQATAHLQDGLEHYRAIGYQEGVASAAQGLAVASLQRGDYDAARHGLAEALDLHRRLGHRDGVATVLDAYAELHAAYGDDRRAVTLLAATEKYRVAIDVPPTRPHALVLDRLRRGLTARLPPGDIADATARGEGMAMDAAIALALG